MEQIKQCREAFGEFKVNLTRDEDSTNGEGIWVTPCTKEDAEIYQDASNIGKKFQVFLLNDPFSWHGLGWGKKITARNNSQRRAYARLSDNPQAGHDEITEARVKRTLWQQMETK
jgi:hypothetical protein